METKTIINNLLKDKKLTIAKISAIEKQRNENKQVLTAIYKKKRLNPTKEEISNINTGLAIRYNILPVPKPEAVCDNKEDLTKTEFELYITAIELYQRVLKQHRYKYNRRLTNINKKLEEYKIGEPYFKEVNPTPCHFTKEAFIRNATIWANETISNYCLVYYASMKDEHNLLPIVKKALVDCLITLKNITCEDCSISKYDMLDDIFYKDLEVTQDAKNFYANFLNFAFKEIHGIRTISETTKHRIRHHFLLDLDEMLHLVSFKDGDAIKKFVDNIKPL